MCEGRYAGHVSYVIFITHSNRQETMEPFTFVAGAMLGAGGMWAARRAIATLAHAAQPGLGDLLGWAFLVGEGVVVMKDGSFLAGMSVRGRDLGKCHPPGGGSGGHGRPRCDVPAAGRVYD